MTQNDIETLRRDGLGEVATIGAGHAATALSPAQLVFGEGGTR